MTIHVIGAGLGRTGTTSLKLALEQLGFGPCYHMTEAIKHPPHAKRWLAAWQGEGVDWAALLHGYGAAVDFPACSFYQELMEAYPGAKVVLTMRDPESWYESAYETIYQILQAVPRWARWLPWIGDLYRMTERLVWQGHFDGRFADRTHAIQEFNRWNAHVQATVPAERLLVFNVKQGWEPLCAFLGVDVPSTPFPHANDRAKMVLGRRLLLAFRYGVPLLAMVSVAVNAFVLVRSRLRQPARPLGD